MGIGWANEKRLNRKKRQKQSRRTLPVKKSNKQVKSEVKKEAK